MEKNTFKPLVLSAFILCAAFAVMELISRRWIQAAFWAAGAWLALALYRVLFNQPADQKARMAKLKSLHTPETLARLEAGEHVLLQPENLELEPGEVCCWYDAARQDHYEGHTGIMYLTDKSLRFDADGFSFVVPLQDLQIIPTRDGFMLMHHKRKMKFVSASTPALLAVYKSLPKSSAL